VGVKGFTHQLECGCFATRAVLLSCRAGWKNGGGEIGAEWRIERYPVISIRPCGERSPENSRTFLGDLSSCVVREDNKVYNAPTPQCHRHDRYDKPGIYSREFENEKLILENIKQLQIATTKQGTPYIRALEE
jgi:hypothetical protein